MYRKRKIYVGKRNFHAIYAARANMYTQTPVMTALKAAMKSKDTVACNGENFSNEQHGEMAAEAQ